MKIIIRNYRCYSTEKTFTFQPGMTNLRGPSGSGKSTILSALIWVLYGKERSISPGKTFRGRTHVTLMYDNIQIDRYTNTKLLEVTYTDDLKSVDSVMKKLIDDRAQAYIDNIFGDLTTFKISSTILQKQFNNFLYLSQKERTTFLESLCESPINFEKGFEKINEEIRVLQGQLDKVKIELNVNMGLMQKVYPGINLAKSDDKTVDVLSTDLIKLKEHKKIYDLHVSKVNEINIKIKFLTEKYNKIPKDIKERIDNLKAEQEALTVDKLIIKAKDLSNTIRHYGNISEPVILTDDNIPVDLRQLEASKKWETLMESYIGQLVKLGISDITLLSEEITRVSQLKSTVNDHLIMFKIKNIESSINQDLPDTNVIEEKIKKQMKKQMNVERSKDILTCPHCQKYVRYNNKSLIPENHIIPESLGDDLGKDCLKSLQGILSQCHYRDQKVIELNNLNSTLSDKESIWKNHNDMNKDMNRLETLINIKNHLDHLGPRPIPSVDLLQRQKRQEERRKWQQLNQLKTELEEIQTQILQMNYSLDKPPGRQSNVISSELMRYTIMLEDLDSFQLELKTLNDTQNTFLSKIDHTFNASLINKIEEQLTLRKKQDQYLIAIEKYQQIDIVKNKLEVNVKNHMLFKEGLQHIEITLFEDLISDINGYLEGILSDIFDTNITVKLEVVKTLKTTERVKPQVYFKVDYRGIESENTDGLSGGEADRLSLALTIAFHKLTGSKILFLDESLNSLNEETRNITLSKVKHMLKGDIVICVYHGETSNIFHHQVDIDS